MKNMIDLNIARTVEQENEIEITDNKDFSSLHDNYEPDNLDEESHSEDEDISEGSAVDQPDLDKDEISRVFPNEDNDLPDPDEVDGTVDFDAEIDSLAINIPEDEEDDI